MKRSILLALIIVALGNCRTPQTSQLSNLDYVDPAIGNVGFLLEPTLPTVQVPNQVIRMAPQRKDFLAQTINSFPLTIVSHRLGQVFAIKPALGPISNASYTEPMPFDHDLEVRQPWFYSTYLIRDEIKVDFTPGNKTGYFNFGFPAAGQKALLLNNYNNTEAEWSFPSDREITGKEVWHNTVPVYLYGQFTEAGTPGIMEKGVAKEGKTISGRSAAVYISFPEQVREVGLRYAISFVSAEQARKNFDAELKDRSFRQLAETGKAAWAAKMNQIQVEGGTTAQRRSFYTALYRTYERMVNITEDSLYYSGYNNKINSSSQRPFYVDDWSWDSYLAHHPLRMILDPTGEEDMLQSYVTMYEQSGWIPTFPVLFGDHICMNGFHPTIVFLDAYRKGLKRIDYAKAYEGNRKSATEATMLPWRNGPKTPLEDFYYEKGYYPSLDIGAKETEPAVHPFEKRQSVALTLGHSYDDWALAEMAGELGNTADKQLFAPRAMNYKNLWNAERGFFLPRNNKGEFLPIDPRWDGGMGGRDYYDENNGWTYMWQVQQDIPGLMALMGGREKFENRLDQLFTEGLGRSKYEFWSKFPDHTGLVGQYSMGNEPSFHIPYLYNFTNSPWKTQKSIRFLLDTWFKDNIFGIPGDEDGGGMTAFVVFSSMGFYPVTPGKPLYTIGSPVFSKVTINLTNGNKFTLIANNSSVVNKYIQKASLNGKELTTPWFTHEDLLNGGQLVLEMGPLPNKQWGKPLSGF
ncbi:MAG: GH92 family glycosyl hydrolase [Candidatus Pseudobacter hemicellulosilyticus]|uniref:GH92 family glycosyl hydrolase n=1 Tax=Candidatus Pseudobacter hemicellulosilyticus TaxID=3121375 RepID=A0AAJ6BH96_9BACT|nr:MAG: GH92 family glycosyl hydrolase [Pseudobacter sp.]